MRLASKIFLGLASATALAVLAPIGCGVDSNRFPGIGSEVPNGNGAGSGGASGTTTSKTNSGTPGTVANVCQCAAFTLVPDAGACGTCARGEALTGGLCAQLQIDCNNDPTGACGNALGCAAICAANPDPSLCMEACAIQSDIFQALLTCQCGSSNCQKDCTVQSPIKCDLGTGGTGGSGTGGSGTGGTGTGGTGTGGSTTGTGGMGTGGNGTGGA
jgi:hypothetical protein